MITRLRSYLTLCCCLATAILFLNLISCKDSTGPQTTTDEIQPLPALTIPWTPDSSVVCFGTSLTYGYHGFILNPIRHPSIAGSIGEKHLPAYIEEYQEKLSLLSTDVDSSYPKFLANRLKIKVYNEGYVGAKISRALELVDDSVLSKKPALVLLEFGANDFIQGISVDSAETQLNRLAGKLRSHGCTVVLVSFFNPDMINRVAPDYPLLSQKDLALAYYAMFQRVAQKVSLEMIDYPLKGIFGNTGLMSDSFHPNGQGYKKMEDNISRALMNTLSRNGMLR